MVLQHETAAPLGMLAEQFEARGYEIEPYMVTSGEPGARLSMPEVEHYDVVVTMGSRFSSYDLDGNAHWVLPELDLLRAADHAGIPVLGICFGGQMLATAHGGEVAASSAPEYGWTEVATSRPEIVGARAWFQWHGDRWTLPPGAVEIAHNSAASQAFTLRRNLAVQFHPELTPNALEDWLEAGCMDTVDAHRVALEELLADTARRYAKARAEAGHLVDGFLDHVAGAG